MGARVQIDASGKVVLARGVTVVLLSALAASALAQAPAGPPPASSSREATGPESFELLPDIGRIGAEVGLYGGASFNPYRVGQGIAGGGFIDLPLTKAPGGKLSYEIFMLLSIAKSEPFSLSVAPGDTRSVRTRLRLLGISPFSLKYTLTGLDRARLRPYLAAGVDVLVSSLREETESGEPLAQQYPEIAERRDAGGEGSIEIGGHAAAGVEVRLTSGLSLNIEYRYTLLEGKNARLQTAGAALGIHW